MNLEGQELTELARSLPKTELHLHIEGTLEADLILKLAQRNKVDLKQKTVQQLKDLHDFHSLQSFLDVYYQSCSVLLKEEDFFDLAWEYFLRAKADGIVHAEIFFDPQTHTQRNVPFADVINGLVKAQKKAESELGITSYYIMCFLRDLSEEEAFKTLEEALPYKNLIKAVGLDSAEVGHPPKKFQRVYAKAIEQGLLAVAHAGEEGPPQFVEQALDLLKVKRIDHGTRSIQNPGLIERLVKEKIPLTCCPFSNLFTKCCSNLQEHSIKRLMDLGVIVTINSDDPAYFGGYLLDNIVETCKALKFSKEQLATICRNSIIASFLPEEEKEKHIINIKI